ncbi:MAG: NTP transferase domain-containing protein [Candidatus Nanopelagicales bacterium]
MTAPWSLVILTGGDSRRMGSDKSRLRVGGRTLLERLIAATPSEVPVIVVGLDPGRTSRPVVVTREDPPGGGPVAGIAAGLEHVDTSIVVVAAVDLPFAGAELPQLAESLSGLPGSDAVVPVVADRRQPLAAAYRTDTLRSALSALGDPRGRPVRELLSGLVVSEVAGAAEFDDVDTPRDLAAARQREATIMGATEEGSMDEWVTAVAAELGVPGDVDVDLVLEVAKEAAHKVQRPAAPVTTFLMGAAVGAGKDPREAAAAICALAENWPDQD